MQFKTASGATYTVKDNLIAREEGRTPIVGMAFPDVDPTVCAQEFEWLVEPKIGERAVYELLASGEVIYTSLVREIGEC